MGIGIISSMMVTKNQQMGSSNTPHRYPSNTQKALQAAQDKATLLFKQGKYIELLSVMQGMHYFLAELKGQANIWPSRQRIFRRDKLALLQNRALTYHCNQMEDEAVNLLLMAVNQVMGLIDDEKMRLGFEEDSVLKGDGIRLIWGWQFQLTKIYYGMAVFSLENDSLEMTLVSTLKSLDLVTQLYQTRVKASESRDREDGCKIEELLLLIKMSDCVDSRRKMSTLDVKTMIRVISWLLNQPFEQQAEDEDLSALAFKNISRLQIISNGRLSTSEASSVQGWKSLQQVVALHCLNMSMLSVMEQVKNNVCEQSGDRNTKGSLFLAIITTYIAKKYLSPSKHLQQILQYYRVRFYIKNTINQSLTFTNLCRLLNFQKTHLQVEEVLQANLSERRVMYDVSLFMQERVEKNAVSRSKKKVSEHMKTMTSTNALHRQLKEERKTKVNGKIKSKKSSGKDTLRVNRHEQTLNASNNNLHKIRSPDNKSKAKKLAKLRSTSRKGKDRALSKKTKR